MRLTLRTMLAYLDEILEPADAQELGKKIEQSEFASNLVHHIRASTRRLRLAAPALDGKGLGHDPNTVAEYLDNTLPQERVPEFEKVCLESDMHLSEVASCHQILALVLGESADVEPAIRNRVYRIHAGEAANQRRDESRGTNGSQRPAAKSRAASLPADAAAAEDDSKARPRPEVPDYLRSGRGIRIKPLAITLAVAFLLAVGGLWLLGPLNSQHPVLGRLFPASEQLGVADQRDPAPSSTSTRRDAGPGSATTQPAQDRAARPNPDLDSVTTDPSDPKESSDPGVPDPDAAKSDPVPTPPTDATPDLATAGKPTVDKPTADEPADDVPADKVPKSDQPRGSAAPADEPSPPAPTTGEHSADVPPTADETAGDSEPISPRSEVGRFLSEQQVLVSRERNAEHWRRLLPLAPLSATDQLIALPGFRPQIALMSGVHVTFLGESAVELGPALDDGVASMVVEQGRLLFFTDGTVDGARMALVLGGRQGVLSFESTDAMAAIEVRPYLYPGTNPESGPAHRVVQIVVTAGEVEWSERSESGETTPFSIRSGQMHTLLNDQPGQTIAAPTPPGWVDPGQGTSGVDGVAAKALERLLDAKRPVSVGLYEQLTFRQADVRSLVARCLSQLDQFDPLIDQFNDKDLRSYWSSGFDAIQLAIARHPQTAVAVRTSIEKRRPDNAQLLYRMLWGYSPEQLDQEGARQLVKALEAPHVDIRVLAAENLRRITGKMYFADKEPERQKAALVRWKNMEREKQIVYKSPPSPFPTSPTTDAAGPAER